MVDWAVEAVRSAFARPSWARTGNLALDLLIVLRVHDGDGVGKSWCRARCCRQLGLYADGYYFWDPLHAIAAKALLALLLVHVVAHWRWLVGFFKNGKGERHGK